jgi:hypothetical protein
MCLLNRFQSGREVYDYSSGILPAISRTLMRTLRGLTVWLRAAKEYESVVKSYILYYFVLDSNGPSIQTLPTHAP